MSVLATNPQIVAQALRPVSATKVVAQSPTKVKEVESSEVRKIVMSRVPGGKWEVEFSASVGRRDINRLRQALLVHFSRMKRKARRDARRATRTQGPVVPQEND